MVSAFYIKLQANKDHDVTGVEGGGLAIYQITASVTRNIALPFDHQSPQVRLHRLDINVSADQGKRHASNHITNIIELAKNMPSTQIRLRIFQGTL